MNASTPPADPPIPTKDVIRALCALRPEGVKYFFKEALELMNDDQRYQLMQKMGEWLSANPPKGR